MNEPADPRPQPRPRRSIDVDRDYFTHLTHLRGHAMRYRWDPANPLAGRRMSPPVDTDVRASDAERNEVADKLSRHFAEGRLDQAEFKDRLDQAMGAKTRGDLQGLFDDLPRLAVEPAPPPSRRRRLAPFLLIVAFVAIAASTTFTFAHGVHLTWLLFVVAALFLWTRVGRHHHHSHHQSLES